MKKIALVGETTAKKSFLYGLLNAGNRSTLTCNNDTVVEVVRAKDFFSRVEGKSGETLQMMSVNIPDEIKLFADFHDVPWFMCDNVTSADMILFIEMYPFVTDSLIRRLKNIEKHLSRRINDKRLGTLQYRVVFLKDSELQLGAMEIVDMDQVLEQAPGQIKEKLEKIYDEFAIEQFVDYVVCRDMKNLPEIFSAGGKSFDMLISIGETTLKRWKSNLEFFYDDYRSYYLQEFDWGNRVEEFHYNVNAFIHVRRRPDIFAAYADNYRGKSFEKVKRFALERYEDYIHEVCFWNIDEDKAELARLLDRICDDNLRFDERLSCPPTQADYQKLLANKKIDVHFADGVKALETEKIPQAIYGHLTKKEELLMGWNIRP